jgi:HEAT repeat protein
MTASRDIEAQISSFEALRGASPAVAESTLRKALQHRNNYLVSKAAKLIADLSLTALIPDLETAFHRFLPQSGKDHLKTDPQCWAKAAIAKALATLEHQEHELFLLGARHIQLEPVWGGSSDTAGTLRSTCALALVQCRSLNSTSLLAYLAELFADKELPVRVNAARAVEQIGSDAAMLMLRLRAELASDAPELLGACYSGVLHLEGPSAIPWAAKFLSPQDDASGEAAIAIAETRTPQAFTTLQAAYQTATDHWFRATLLSAIALSRQDEAFEWLLALIRDEHSDSIEAHEALCRSGPPNAILEKLIQLGKPCS